MNKEHKNFKPFDKVLVKFAKEGAWVSSIYSHWDEDFDAHNTLSGIINDDSILPYEGNEDLLGKVGSPTPKRWRAEKGQYYWCINATIVISSEDNIYVDNNRYSCGNYFRTEKEAREKLEQIKQILKGE